jgi:hypothetical protein
MEVIALHPTRAYAHHSGLIMTAQYLSVIKDFTAETHLWRSLLTSIAVNSLLGVLIELVTWKAGVQLRKSSSACSLEKCTMGWWRSNQAVNGETLPGVKIDPIVV